MRRRRTAAATILLALFSVCAAPAVACAADPDASSVQVDLPVPGGAAAVLAAVGIPDMPPALLISAITHRLYAAPRGQDGDADRGADRLAAYLARVAKLQSALAAAEARDGSVSLASVEQKNQRKSIEELLELIGLKLRRRGGRFEIDQDKPSPEAAQCLSVLGVEPGSLVRDLNQGKHLHLALPSGTVPVPLRPSIWSEAVFDQATAAAGLVGAILADRRAALLAAGLSSLDDDTLEYLAAHPDTLKRLYEHDAAVFAAFGRSLHVRANRVFPPGGANAAYLWETLLGESTKKPDRFIRGLFADHDGRTAYLFDAIASLDAPHAAFALGTWIRDPEVRRARFEALADASYRAYSPYQPTERPFLRAPADLLALLTRVRVGAGGEPSPPNWQRFWKAALDGSALPDDPARQLRDVATDGSIDAAWLANVILTAVPADRADKLDRLSFAQRVFHGKAEESLPDVLVAARAATRFRTLMLTLDRVGITDPSIYAAAARRANDLAALDHTKAFIALGQFQSALALIARLRLVQVVDGATADRLVRSLVALDLSDGRYRGALASWMARDFLPALPPPGGTGAPDPDDRLEAALAGEGSKAPAAALPPLTWEGRSYRLDLAGAARRRLALVRKRQGSRGIGPVLALWTDVQTLASASEAQPNSLDTVRDVAARLPGHVSRPDSYGPPPGVDSLPDPARIIADAQKRLRSITRLPQLTRAAEVAAPLTELCDSLLADALLSYTYALALGDPGGAVLLGGNVARRHDFGLAAANDEERVRTAWQLATQEFAPGVPWHARGSVLGLDVALGSLSLRRVAADQTAAEPVLNGNDRRTFVQSVALLEPFAMSDGDRDEMAAAIGRGRARVGQGATDPAELAALLDAVPSLAVDGQRKRAIRWVAAHDPASLEEWFSMTELLALGAPARDIHANGWGMSALPFDDCLCTELLPQPWQVFAGQTSTGLLASVVADLNLRVAEITATLRVPAAVSQAILQAAMQQYVNTVRPVDDDDWYGLFRAAGRLSTEQVEDDMAALTAEGMLMPADAPPDSTRR